MPLFLAQHGRALPEEVDPERGLSEEGAAEVRRMAKVAGAARLGVLSIQHSGKKRARQTAELFAEELHPVNGVHARRGLNPGDDVAAVASTLTSAENLMLVGHLPFMARLVSLLVAGDAERPVIQIQNAGIVCLDRDVETRDWIIQWALVPRLSY